MQHKFYNFTTNAANSMEWHVYLLCPRGQLEKCACLFSAFSSYSSRSSSSPLLQFLYLFLFTARSNAQQTFKTSRVAVQDNKLILHSHTHTHTHTSLLVCCHTIKYETKPQFKVNINCFTADVCFAFQIVQRLYCRQTCRQSSKRGLEVTGA